MIAIERLATYTAEDASAIGHLMPFLNDEFSDSPIDEQLLQEIINSDHHDMLVARDDSGRIIGVATLSLVLGPTGRKAYLEDFVTHPDTRGVGSALWDEMGKWCLERDVTLNFTSRPSRSDAHHFYLNRGAKIRDTTVFKKDFNEE